MSSLRNIDQLKKDLESAARAAGSRKQFMEAVARQLHDRMLKYNWVGFYMIEKGSKGQPDMLVLGPFVGSMTPHSRIALNQGICGAAASSGKTIVVHDVKSDPRYLACSADTKSEIVVPIFAKGTLVGELDIDSHFRAAFQQEDIALVEYCAALVGQFLEKFGAREYTGKEGTKTAAAISSSPKS